MLSMRDSRDQKCFLWRGKEYEEVEKRLYELLSNYFAVFYDDLPADGPPKQTIEHYI